MRSLDKEARAFVFVTKNWRGEYVGRISGGREALELAADSWEATPLKGARSKLTSAHEVEPTPGGLEPDTRASQ
jgi:hypothetical protein